MNGAQGQPGQGQGQPSGGQPQQGAQPQQGQQAPRMTLYKPENMRTLPEQFSQAEKQKWEHGLRQLWTTVEKNAADTPAHQDAKRKLIEFSKTLTAKIQHFRQQQQARLQQQPNAQAAQSVEAARAATPRISQKILEHVNNFPYSLPLQLTQGSPEAMKYIQETKSKYLKGLMGMETAKGRMVSLDAVLETKNNEGNPLSAEEEKQWREKKDAAQKSYNDAQRFVEEFRKQQAQQQQQQQNATQQPNSSQAPATNTTTTGAPVNNMAMQNPVAAPRPQMNLQQPNVATQTVNAAIEAARNQQMGGVRPPIPNQPGQAPQAQAPNSNANIPQNQAGAAPHIKMEAGVPGPINTAVAHVGNQVRTGSIPNNSPQTAHPQSAHPQSAHPQSAGPQSAGPHGVPRPLTHQAALSQAARSYSSGQTTGTPNVMGMGPHAHPTGQGGRETPNAGTTKMPIPKNLPPNSVALPQPVTMPQPRPTYSGGPSNTGNGVMGQPVVHKTPGFVLDSEGERVLNKKKLDELVKQVTGGGDGLGPGEGLTAETEESILNVADAFVDQVLQSACKNAKERGAHVLEIRDIQLTLERQYNIRIPGYASDEIRTVRKIQPAPAWISKMSAVQAAKVTRKDDN
ncbi:Transcription initiation factor TFIID subunit 12 [Phlyctema vagabunda]|uniref:Transcription initiation factor TFIID subunit 12 n=1 Tax=Phlyctema vagabunda TaxID=108571 RepID=A0ABR4P983_9HELO